MRHNISLALAQDEESIVYDVILPLKEERRLSTVVVGLLRAYRENDYVRGLIDNDMMEQSDALQEAFREKFNKVTKSFSESGMIQEETMEILDEGVEDLKGGFEDLGINIVPDEAQSGSSDNDRLTRIEESLALLVQTVLGTTQGDPRPFFPTQTAVDADNPGFCGKLAEDGSGVTAACTYLKGHAGECSWWNFNKTSAVGNVVVTDAADEEVIPSDFFDSPSETASAEDDVTFDLLPDEVSEATVELEDESEPELEDASDSLAMLMQDMGGESF